MPPLSKLALVASALVAGAGAQSTVPRCKLGASALEVSCVIMGSLHLHETGSPVGALQVINSALALGIDTWDTSDVYRQMPELFGAAIQLQPGLREKLTVIAKMDITGAWPNSFGFDSGSVYDSGAAHLQSVLQRYLTALNTTFVDVAMLHHQDYLLDLSELVPLVRGWISSGVVRAFGVSNFDKETFATLAAALAPIPLVANEIELSVLQPAAIVDGRVSYHYGQGSSVLAWGPLGGDCWGGANRLFGVLSLDSSQSTPRIRSALTTVGNALLGGVGPDVAAVAWLLRHPSKILPIIGTMNATRMAQQSVVALAAAANMTRGQWYHIADAAKVPIW